MFREFCTSTMQFPLVLSPPLSLCGKVCASGHCLADVSPWKSISNVNIRLSETATKATVAVAFQHETFIRSASVCVCMRACSVSGSRWNLCKDTVNGMRSHRLGPFVVAIVAFKMCTWIASSIINKRHVYISSYIWNSKSIAWFISKSRMHRLRRLYALHAM